MVAFVLLDRLPYFCASERLPRLKTGPAEPGNALDGGNVNQFFFGNASYITVPIT